MTRASRTAAIIRRAARRAQALMASDAGLLIALIVTLIVSLLIGLWLGISLSGNEAESAGGSSSAVSG